MEGWRWRLGTHRPRAGALVAVALVGVAAAAALGHSVGVAALGVVPPDLGPTMDYAPLVRHQISQRHCYDNGSFLCEETASFKPAFDKEFTLGYLFQDSRQPALGLAPLYHCVDKRRGGTGFNFVLADTVDGDARRLCRDLGFRPFLLGHIARTPAFEAPQALYRCWGFSFDSLLTDDPNECGLSGYFFTERLGYLAAGGTLPLRRLSELCAAIDSPHCIATDGFAAASDEPSPVRTQVEQLLQHVTTSQ